MSAPTKLQRWLDLIAFLASRRFPVPVDELWSGVPAYTQGVGADPTTHASVRRMFERDKKDLNRLGIPIETVTFDINYGHEQATGYRLKRRDFHLPYLRLVREAAGERGPAAGPPSGTTGEPGSTAREAGGRQPGTAVKPSGAGASAAEFEISEAEASAALEGLRYVAELPGFTLSREARSAFRKLAFDLDADLLRDAPVHQVTDPETERSTEALRRLSDALLARKTVRFDYHSIGRDAREERSVRPYGLFFQHGRWYLVGHDEDRDEPRVYRVGRVSDVRANPKTPGTPDYEVPGDFRLERYTGRSAWELGGGSEGELEATVRFRFPRSMWAERNGHGRLVEELEDGTQLRAFEVHRRDPFLRWVLSLGGDATVESPPDVRGDFQRIAAEVAARHGSQG